MEGPPQRISGGDGPGKSDLGAGPAPERRADETEPARAPRARAASESQDAQERHVGQRVTRLRPGRGLGTPGARVIGRLGILLRTHARARVLLLAPPQP